MKIAYVSFNKIYILFSYLVLIIFANKDEKYP